MAFQVALNVQKFTRVKYTIGAFLISDQEFKRLDVDGLPHAITRVLVDGKPPGSHPNEATLSPPCPMHTCACSPWPVRCRSSVRDVSWPPMRPYPFQDEPKRCYVLLLLPWFLFQILLPLDDNPGTGEFFRVQRIAALLICVSFRNFCTWWNSPAHC